VPLSAGGWAWRPSQGSSAEPGPHRFRDHERHAAGRVLAGDAYTSGIYNLNGSALLSRIWNDPTQFDNTVAWGRHPTPAPDAASANLLFQDGHVRNVQYCHSHARPLNTAQTFVWYPGEPLDVGPGHYYDGNWYPDQPPPGFQSDPPGNVFPREMTPAWYTQTNRWTLISHK
jgi:prepilin-type processing-associated H-X9-DG protein